MDDRQYRDHVIESLAELKASVKGINEHLARLNGSVAKHAEKLVELEQTKVLRAEQIKKISEDLDELKKKLTVDGKTLITLVAIFAGAGLALFRVDSPVLNAITALIR